MAAEASSGLKDRFRGSNFHASDLSLLDRVIESVRARR